MKDCLITFTIITITFLPFLSDLFFIPNTNQPKKMKTKNQLIEEILENTFYPEKNDNGADNYTCIGCYATHKIKGHALATMHVTSFNHLKDCPCHELYNMITKEENENHNRRSMRTQQ